MSSPGKTILRSLLGALLPVVVLAAGVALIPQAAGQEEDAPPQPRVREHKQPGRNPGRTAADAPATGPVVKMQAPGRAAVGETVSLEIRIEKGAQIGHVPFHVGFDPTILAFDGAEEGPFLGSDGNDTVFVAQTNTRGDEVVVGLSRLGRVAGVDGDGLLCTLRFRTLAAGDVQFRFERANVRDSANRIVGDARFVPMRLAVR